MRSNAELADARREARASAGGVALPGPLCPALIVPQDQADFSVSVGALLALASRPGESVEVLGPGGRPLLHARSGGTEGSALQWLELVTTPASPYPHARAGPLGAGAHQHGTVEIAGPQGDVFGWLARDGACWRVRHSSGRPVLLINVASQGAALSAHDASGAAVAFAATKEHGRTLQVRVEPGADALLVLLCALATVLASPPAPPS